MRNLEAWLARLGSGRVAAAVIPFAGIAIFVGIQLTFPGNDSPRAPLLALSFVIAAVDWLLFGGFGYALSKLRPSRIVEPRRAALRIANLLTLTVGVAPLFSALMTRVI